VATLVLSTEADFTNHYCQGVIEYVLPDRTRIDCLLEDYAIEYDWASKWYEAVGQSLHYAMHTGRRAGIVLIVREAKDYRHVDKAYRAIRHYGLPITLWTVHTEFGSPVLYKDSR
jgi:hypothetical protein